MVAIDVEEEEEEEESRGAAFTTGYALHIRLSDPDPPVRPPSATSNALPHPSPLSREEAHDVDFAEDAVRPLRDGSTSAMGSGGGSGARCSSCPESRSPSASAGPSYAPSSCYDAGSSFGSSIAREDHEDEAGAAVDHPRRHPLAGDGHWDLHSASVPAQLSDAFLKAIIGLPAPVFESLCAIRQEMMGFLQCMAASETEDEKEESEEKEEEGGASGHATCFGAPPRRQKGRNGSRVAISSEVFAMVERLMTAQATLLSGGWEEEESSSSAFSREREEGDGVVGDTTAAILASIFLPLPSSTTSFPMRCSGREKEEEEGVFVPFSEATKDVWRRHYQQQEGHIAAWMERAQQRVGRTLEEFGIGEFVLSYAASKDETRHRANEENTGGETVGPRVVPGRVLQVLHAVRLPPNA